ncbi:MAG: rod-binding protein [Planctomycetota bacterium]|nr:rod-binding protein [Planctomycetota bacterium]
MNIQPVNQSLLNTLTSSSPLPNVEQPTTGNSLNAGGDELSTREAFDKFVGGTFYNQLLGSMQKTVGKAPYFHGGQAEDMFRSQLNQILADKMAESSSERLTGPMFELFSLNRQ